jgi:hypothetical protein
MKNKKLDKYWIGIATGLTLPFLVMCVVYLLRFNGRFPFSEFISKMIQISAFPALLSLCAVVNLGAFFLYYQKWYNNAARGVIIATMFFVIVVITMKFNDL